jgi:hypothetical protein
VLVFDAQHQIVVVGTKDDVIRRLDVELKNNEQRIRHTREYGPFDYSQKVTLELSYSDLINLKVALIDAREYAQDKWSDYPSAVEMIDDLQNRIRAVSADVECVLPR